jgi:hypothetical protein
MEPRHGLAFHKAVIRKRPLSPRRRLAQGRETAGQPVEIAELYSRASELAAEEESGVARIVSAMLPVLAWLNGPVALRPGSLGGSFLGCRSVTLGPGLIVVMTDNDGRVSSRQLLEFKTKERLAVLKESHPELQRMVAEKRRAGEVKPLLSLKVALGGGHLLADRRGYRLVISNKGGDCLGLSVRLHAGGTKPSKPCDLPRGTEAEYDLGLLREAGVGGPVKVSVECKDVDGRELVAEEALFPGGAWKEALLKRTN